MNNPNQNKAGSTPEKALKDNENISGPIVPPVDFEKLDAAATPEVGRVVEPEPVVEQPKVEIPEAETKPASNDRRKVKLLKDAYLNSRLYEAGTVLEWVGPSAGSFMVDV